MRFHTFNRIVTHLDEKIEINQKKFRISFFLPFSLRATLKRSVESWFLPRNDFLEKNKIDV